MSTTTWVSRELHALELKGTENYAEALRLFEKLIQDVKSNPDQETYLLKLRGFYGECLYDLDRFAEAETYHRVTMKRWELQKGEDSTEGRARIRLLLATSMLAQCGTEGLSVDASTKKATDSISLLQSALDSETESLVAITACLAESFATLGEIRLNCGETEASQQLYKKAVDTGRATLERQIATRCHDDEILCTKFHIAEDLYKLGNIKEAKEIFQFLFSQIKDLSSKGEAPKLEFTEKEVDDYLEHCSNNERRMSTLSRWKRARRAKAFYGYTAQFEDLLRACRTRSNWRLVFGWCLFNRMVRAYIKRKRSRVVAQSSSLYLNAGTGKNSIRKRDQATNVRKQTAPAGYGLIRRTSTWREEYFRPKGQTAHSNSRGELFDSHPAEQSPESDKWLRAFGELTTSLTGYTEDKDIDTKVAILDTGIDAQHPWIKQRWKRDGLLERGFRDFVNDTGDPPEYPRDNDGHGTHCAGLILQYARRTSLYVARVASSHEECQNDPEFGLKVANAINYAVQNWGVNIISMSFGLNDEDISVGEALAYASRERVCVFAAASNDGLRQGIAYPASRFEVFCVHAAEGSGRAASFTPQARVGHMNYSMLGTSVLSAWPDFRQSDTSDSRRVKGVVEVANAGTWKHQSGTSQATPIAVVMAVHILRYGLTNGVPLARYDPQDLVRRVFQGMSKYDNGYHSILPWEGTRGRFKHYRKRGEFDRSFRMSISEDS
ncbi:peptidase S8/S53 domain-containing protein [Lophiotrema nucula]|uniref:Peptidase S8/S53 domain-containing protein n=1 Tax=Lophiotrema nucula TaxID=690887 RepID=A0A6A5YJX8_9PLEO|nr:peptidase S8/S53 domain-containing protein [Lophiotrema nucula]